MTTRMMRIREDNVYYERHHIIPKSMGGSDTVDNLVYLTAKEHFLSHLLLTKITEGEIKAKMIYAFGHMSFYEKYKKKHITSRLYQVLREECSVVKSESLKGKTTWMKGKRHTDEARRKMSESHKGRTAWNRSKKTSDEVKQKISEAKKGYIPTIETRRKLSEASKKDWARRKSEAAILSHKTRKAK